MNGDHQNRNFGKQVRNLPATSNPFKSGIWNIQQNQCPRIFLNSLQGFSAGASLVANLPRALLLQQRAQIVTDRRVIVDYEKYEPIRPSFQKYR